jgi:hypothetical protein
MPAAERVQALSDAEVSKVGGLAVPEKRIHALRDQLAAVLSYIDGRRRLISGVWSRWRASARGRTGLMMTRQDRRSPIAI